MDSTFGRDPAIYWVKLEYDDETTEIYDGLTLNQAFELENEKRKEQQSHYHEWTYSRYKRHIKHIKAGCTR